MFKLIPILLYILLIFGELLLLGNSIQNLYYKSLFKQKRDELKDKLLQPSNTIFDRLNMMLEITLNIQSQNGGYYFVLISLLTGALLFATLTILFSVKLGAIGLIAGLAIPYLILRTKLQSFQVNISKEGERLIAELSANYTLNYQNIKEAIQQTAISIKDSPNSKKMLLALSRSLNKAASRGEVVDAIETFRYSISTSWGDILATNISFAYFDNLKITESLNDLQTTVTHAMMQMEQNKRENNESKILIYWVFPITLVISYLAATKMFDITPKQFFHNQFQTELGLTWIIVLAVFYIVSIFICTLLTKNKMDI